MLRKTVILFIAVSLSVLPAASEAYAWGACHVGYTAVGPYGAYHRGLTVGPYGAYSRSSMVGPYGGYHHATGYSGGYVTGGFCSGGSDGNFYRAGTYRGF